jgi:two-component system OmpR family sensor kinase/two-component system sensor histidine kinase BaeS
MADLKASINSIRRRLVLILVRAFGIVVLLTVGLTLITTALRISQESDRNPFYRSPAATILESFYLGHGSWDGIQAVLGENNNPNVRALRPGWQQTILVNGSGEIILDNGRIDTPRVGSFYVPPSNANAASIIVNGISVGTLYLEASPIPHSWYLVFPIIPSIAIVSFIAGLFTLILGILLVNRIVNPLAEVIAASQSVADGNLAVRVPVRGRNDDLHALSDHFNHMTETLERNDRERREQLADIAHELRTPLSVLRGRLEGVMDGVYPLSNKFIAPALEETYLLERLVEDLHTLTLAEARKLHIDLKPVDPLVLIERVVDIFKAQADEQKITISVNAETGIPSVMADPQRLEQVIGNLLDNALRYSTEGSQVDISLHQEEKNVRIAVADTGSGLSEDELPLIFNRFWRSDKSRTRLSGGAGLGLAIVKQLIEAQGGKVAAANQQQKGLQISIWLPAVMN